MDEFGFSPHKWAFRDALALRYGWMLLIVPVGHTFQYNILYLVPRGGSPLSGIMRFVTQLAAGCLKSAMMSVSNLYCSRSQVKSSAEPLQQQEMGPGWMLPPMTFGVAVMKGLMSTSKSLIPMLHPTDNNALSPHTEDTRGSRSGLMDSVRMK